MSNTKTETPAEVADTCEIIALEHLEDGDRQAADLFMDPAHAIRRVLNTLHRLNHRVHTNYDFNADPDAMTLEVGEVLKGYTPPSKVNTRDDRRRAPDSAQPNGA